MSSSPSASDDLVRRGDYLDWSSADWTAKGMVILPALSGIFGILILIFAIVLAVREHHSWRRMVFAALAFSTFFYIASNLLQMISEVLPFVVIMEENIWRMRRLASSSWILERFELTLALTSVLLLLIDRAKSLPHLESESSWAKAETALKWLSVGLIGLTTVAGFVSSVLRGVLNYHTFGRGQSLHEYELQRKAEFALYQLLRAAFITALAAILAFGTTLWRRFVKAGRRDLPTIVVTTVEIPLLLASWVVALLFGYYDISANEGPEGWFTMQVFNSFLSLAFYTIILFLGFKKSIWLTTLHGKESTGIIELDKHISDSTPTINRPLKLSEDLEDRQR